MKNKHMSLEDRQGIERGLNNNLSFKEIGKNIDKNCTTVSREIRNHYIIKNTGCFGKSFVVNFKKKFVVNYLKHLMFVMGVIQVKSVVYQKEFMMQIIHKMNIMII